MGPAPEAVIKETAVERLFEAAGFMTERTFVAGDHHYGVIFRPKT